MKLPNNYGTVYRLTGKRRRPWVAKKMIGKELNLEKNRNRIKYVTLGYYESRADALQALAAYNADPYDPVKRARTVGEVYEAWSSEYFPTIKRPRSYVAAWSVLNGISDRPLADITLDDMQFIIDNSGKNTPTLKNVKLLLSLMYEYAVVHEIVPPRKHDIVKYIRLPDKNPNAVTRKIFTIEEIQELWKSPHDMVNRLLLILIFTGLRIGELLALKDEDVDFDTQTIHVTHAKTAAGIRDVPIADKIVPLLQEFMPEKRFSYNYILVRVNKCGHTPHDTRHTFASLAAENGVDQRLIDAILGHSAGSNVALRVYTHFTIEAKLEVVNNLLVICEKRVDSDSI